MSLKDRITEDMKAAMRAKDAERLSTIRMLLAACKQREVDERIELSDDQVIAAIEKMLKQRRESIAQFEKAVRNDLADAEKAEIAVLSAYLPQQMTEAEVTEAVLAAIKESGAAGPKDMGKVMGLLKSRLAGRTDMGKLSGLVKSKLAEGMLSQLALQTGGAYVRAAAGDLGLGDQVDGDVLLIHHDVRVGANGFDQGPFDLLGLEERPADHDAIHQPCVVPSLERRLVFGVSEDV